MKKCTLKHGFSQVERREVHAFYSTCRLAYKWFLKMFSHKKSFLTFFEVFSLQTLCYMCMARAGGADEIRFLPAEAADGAEVYSRCRWWSVVDSGHHHRPAPAARDRRQTVLATFNDHTPAVPGPPTAVLPFLSSLERIAIYTVFQKNGTPSSYW